MSRRQLPPPSLPALLRTGASLHRLRIVVAVACCCAFVDVLVKALVSSPSWAYHQRSGGWWLLSLGVLALVTTLAWVPSRRVAAAAGLVGGGVAANLICAGWDGTVADPLVLRIGLYGVAYNPADVFILAGILLLLVELSRLVTKAKHGAGRPHGPPGDRPIAWRGG
jgi:hypothetical protein